MSLASPDGNWVIEPHMNTEELFIATMDHNIVRQEIQNFDSSGHYSRPEVGQLIVNRKHKVQFK